MTNIGILGSGRVGSGLATKLAAAGHDITLASRDLARDSAKWDGEPVAVAGHAETARAASIVINATPGETTLERLGALREELDGKILIDVANATERGSDGMPGGLSYPNSSLAEHLQQALPGTRVVKTLNTMLFTVQTDPQSLGVPPTAFLSGDDDAAKATATELLAELGWPAAWIEDLGGIQTARATEALVLLVPHIIARRGFAPFAVTIAA